MKKSYFCFMNVCCNKGKFFLATLLLAIFVITGQNGYAQNCNPDVEPPVAVNAPQDVNVQCVDDIPAPANVIFTDNCDNDVDVFFHEMGPAQGIEKCELTDAVGDGSDNWAVWLPNLPFGLTDQWIFNASDPGCLDIYADGTAHMTGRVYADNNPSLYFDIDVWIRDKKDWDTWSGLLTIAAPFINRSFKDDAGFAAAGGNLQTTWDFYVVDNNDAAIIGGGGLSGTYITLEHAPANLFFGVQIGEAANNKNENYGLSTWFTYNGIFNYNGNSTSINGLGDFNFDADCGPNPQSTCEQEIVYMWIAIDDAGNVTTISQTITVEDTIAPELSDCPADVTVQCDNVPTTPNITATDNCDGSVTVNFETQTQNGNCPDAYSILNHWWAIDACGNQVDCFQTVTVIDNEAPVFSSNPADETVQCDQPLPAVPSLTATDNCDSDVMINYNETTMAGDCANEMTIVRIWTAVDNCGNSTMTQQMIYVVDTTNPTLSGVPADATVDCDNIPMMAPVTGNDNCGFAMVSFNEITTGNPSSCSYDIIRTWTATDACGNSVSDSQTLTVVDNEAPVFDSNPNDVTASCDNIPAAPNVTASDNCSNANVSLSVTDNGQDCPLVITRTWTATDECGNSSSISQTVTVTDDENPTLSGGSSGIENVNCGDNPPTPIAPTANDNCDNDVEITLVTENVSPVCNGGQESVQYTWTATDNCGNTATQTYLVQFIDNEAPQLSDCPADITIQCEDELPAPPTLTATDNCDEDVEVSYVEFFNFDGSEATCTASDAAGITNLWSVWLPNLPGGITDSFLWNADGGSFNEFEDYAVLTGTVYADNDPTQIFFVNIRFENKQDWPTWSSQSTVSGFPMPRSFKDDAGFAAAAGNLWTTWDYYTIDPDNSYLIGAGSFAGSMLSLTQAPTNLLFGTQVGEAANNTNANYGLSTWFLYEGTLMGESVSGLGDVNIDLECGPGNQFAKCDYDVTRIWIATDDCGNTNTCLQTISVIDTTAPTFDSTPENMTVQCDEPIPAAPNMTATDNCGEEVTITMDEQTVPGDCPNESTINRVWIAADCCGNTTSISQTITIVDTTAPVVIAAPDAIVECGDDIPAPAADATDNCGDATWTVSPVITETCGDTYVMVRTYTATDECGNTATDTQTITVVDTTAPTIAAAPDATVECGDDIPAPAADAADTCGDATWTVSPIITETCGDTYVMVRTYTATDECGNTATDTQTITVVDTTAPTITAAPDATVECGDDIPAPAADAADSCGDATWTVSPVITDMCGDTYTMVRTYTATDECGNTATATQTITVVDTTPPTITAAADATVECGDDIPAPAADAADTCGDATWTVSPVITETCGDTYIMVRTYTATDDCGNIATDTQTITVVDTTAPTITAAPDATVECGDDIPAPAADAADTCGDATWTVSPVITETCGDTYVMVRTYTATDDCGNTATDTQTITVVDTTAPSITAAADATVECGDAIPAPAADAADSCGDATWTVSTETTETCGETSVIVRTYTATDECGNTATDTQTITVVDTTPPTITAAPDATVECGDDIPAPAADAADSCGDATWTVSPVITDMCGETYTMVRTYTATDECGNTATTTQTITVVDTTPPTITAAPDATVECGDDIPAPAADAADSCGDATWSVSQTTPQGCGDTYTINRVYTATDDCGNTATDTQTITIVDTTPPTITAAPDATVECGDDIPAPDADAADTCGDATWTVSPFITETCGDSYIMVRTYTATDDCGNTAIDTQTITVVDTTAPTITAAPDVTVECGDAIPAPAADAADTCGDATWTVSPVITETCGDTYIMVRTYTATDECGNTATDTQTITVVDTTPPTITAAPDATVECGDDIPAPAADAADTCGDATWTVSPVITETCGDTYIMVRTYTATDDCGNTATDTQTITVVDTTPPTITAAPDATVECGDDIPAPAADAADTCGDATWTVSPVITESCGDTYIMVRTYTATDDCGNTATDTQTITVVDTTPPTITAAPDATVECGDDIPAPAADAADTCGDATWTVSPVITETCGDTYIMVRTYTATDECGNTATDTQTITVVDTTPPTITAAPDATVECGDDIPAPAADAADTCGDATWTVSPVITESCGDTYIMVRTYTAIDECGNTATDTQTITVVDTTAPLLTVAPDQTIDCNDMVPGPSYDTSDSCGNSTVAVTEAVEDMCGNTYTVTRTYTAIDDCGNTTVATQIITLIDTTPPTIVAGADMTIECGDDIPAPSFDASDDCGDVDVSLSQTTPQDCGNTYSIIRVYTATDECGNTATDSQTITIVDTTPPTITAADDETVECGDDIPAPAADAADTCGDATYTVSTQTTETCGDTYILVRTYTATDECGNTATDTQTITVVDTTPPSLTVASDLDLECDEQVPAPSYVANDTCGDVDVVITVDENGDCAQSIIRTYTATDACGNMTVATQTITINDTTAPTLTVGPDMTLECDEAVPAPSYTADDNCNEVTVNVEEVNSPGACAQEYTLTRTYTATDACGNSTSATQVITVQDTTPPTQDAPQISNLDVDCGVLNAQDVYDYTNGLLTPAEEQAFFNYARSLFYQNGLVPTNPQDNCDDEPVIFETSLVALDCDDVTCPAVGQLACTFAPVDECGNQGAAITTTITVIDEEAPILDGVPASLTVDCNQVPNAPLVTATDNCWGEETVSFSEEMILGDCPGNYTLIRTWSASDKCDNTSTASQTITVEDNDAPVFGSTPQDGTFECDNVPGPAAPTASDLCSDVTVSTTEEITPGDCEDHYYITYTYIASDECGNTASISHTYEIEDTTAPVIDPIPLQISVPCEDVPDPADVTATDNCDDDVTIMFMQNDFSGGCAGVLERIWIAKDNCGNESQIVQYVNLIDETAPTFSEDPQDVTVECDEAIPAPIAITAEDNCTEPTLTYSEQTVDGDCPQEYSIIRTYTAIDECENMSSVSYTVFIVDTTAPEFTSVAQDMTLECDETVPAPSASAEDNCGDVTMDINEVNTPGDCPQEYTLVRTYTATDECGNASVATQTITVVDTTAPTMSPLPADVSAECDDVPRAEDVIAIDNCAGAVMVQFSEELIDGPCDYTYTLIRTWTAADNCGNTTSHTQTVEVEDTTDPTFTSTPADETVECDDIPAPANNVTAEDNCDPNPTITYSENSEPGDCPQESYIYRTWTATDDCGNSSSYTQTITVVDTTAPVLSVASDETIECDEAIPAPDYTVSDNCGNPTVEITTVETGDSCETILTRTYTADDGCGNTTSATQIITIVDTTAPTLTVAPDATVECGDDIPAPSYDTDDNCNDVDVIVTPVVTDMCGNTYTMVRTYTATDACGNSTSATQTITVEDTTDPSLEIPSDITLECGTAVPAPGANASDVCGDVTISHNDVITDLCGDTYSIARTYTATDECGNTTSDTQTITFEDTTAPSIEAAADMTIECGNTIPEADSDASDSCGDVTVTVTESQVDGCGGTYTLTRVYTAEDECGNTATDSQVITVIDTTDPYFTSPIPADADVECDAVPAIPAIGVPGGITAGDDCSSVEITFNEEIEEGMCEDSYTIIRTWTVIDDCDNMTSASQTINVSDTTAPTFDVIPSDESVECDDVPPADMVTASDNCDNDVDVVYDELMFSGGCVGVLQRTWTATDNCGNQSVIMQFVTLLDNTAPVIEDCPADATYNCDEAIPAAPQLVATDNCTEVDLTFNEEIIDGSCPQEYSIVRTWTATDNCNNSSTCTQTISVSDDEAPVFTFVAADATIECSESMPAQGANASDNCGDVTISSSEAMTPGSCPQEYTLTITYTATDECGNASTATQVINVEDTTAPVLSGVPADITVSCGNVPAAANPTATDNCGDVEVIFSQFGYNGTDCSGVLTRQWVATDECGNSTSASQTITIIDEVAPELSSEPANDTVECDEVPSAANVTATDNCDSNVDVSFTENIIDGDCEDAYTIVRTWTATDDCDNETSHTQTINVIDTTAPVFVSTPPAQMDVECDNVPSASNLVATDNCDNDVTITYTEQNLSGGCAGTIKRTWVATDNCDNSSVFEQFLFLFDATAPVATAPADYSIDCDENLAPFEAATFTDNCSDVDVDFMESTIDGDCEGSYFIIRTWSGTDACDNTTTVSQTITVSDNQAPTISGAPADVTVECGNVPAAANVTSEDNCGQSFLVFSESQVDGDCPQSYTIVRTWTATDGCDNSASVSQTITVVDTTDPVISGNFNNATVNCANVPSAPSATASDNCDNDVDLDFNEVITPGACEDSYTITRTWTATDDCGNSSTATQTIEVIDNDAPVFSGLPADITVECDNIPAPASADASDTCDDDVDITFSQFGYNGTDCSGTLNRIWVAIDNCGNESTYTQVITIIDSTDPVFTSSLPGDLNVECDEVPAAATVTATDNCGDAAVTLSETIIDGNCEDSYTIIRTWAAEDECDNSITHTQTIVVSDNTPPVFVDVPADMGIDCQDTPDPQDVTVTDNCDNDVTISVEEIMFSGGCVGVIQRTYTAVDNCGNTSEYVQFITLEDNDAPTLVGAPGDVTVECDNIPAAATVTADDNCFEDVDVVYNETINGSGCDYTITRTWTAEDGCDNVATHVQTITVTDSEGPVFVSAPASATVMCDNVPAAATAIATDNCGTAAVSMTEVTTDGCPYQIIRTYTANDGCGNTAVHVQTIDVVDNTDPTFNNFPADVIADCSSMPVPPVVTASDNCDPDVEVVLTESTVVNACNTIITRTWVATDACGNTATQLQTVTLEDNTAPVFDLSSVPADILASCDDIPKSSAPTATDDCHDANITFLEEVTNEVCPGTYTLIRTWTANDGCGNSSSVSQTITVQDNSAPQFIDFPEDETYVCGDDIPAAEMPEVEDGCSSSTLTLNEEIVGQTELNPACELTTPVDGVVGDVWSLFLPGVGSGNFVFDMDNGTYQVVDLGGGNLQGIFTGRVYDPENPCYAFFIEGYMINKLDWATWSSMTTTSAPFVNRSFKDDGNFAAGVGGDVHETWEYWELSSDTKLIGDDCFEGDVLYLDHAPSNLFFGFQVGEAANNRNAAYGMGTWFSYDGELNGVAVDGIGDFAFETYCPPCEYTITRTWTATDDCGNSVSQTQTITVVDPEDGSGIIDGGIGDLDIDATFTATPNTDKFTHKMGASPNPTADNSTITFSISEDDNVRLEVFSMSGKKVVELYTGQAEKDQAYRFDFDGSSLATGIYIYKLTTANNGSYHDKIIITK